MENSESKKFVNFFLNQKLRSYRKRQVIIRPDDKPLGVFYIEKGYVKVYSLLENGEERNHVFYKQGDIFPLVWTFNNIRRDVFFEAFSDTLLRRADRQEFIKFIANDSKMLFEILHRAIAILNVYADRIDTLEYTKTKQRLIDHLLFLARRYGIKQNKKITIQIPLLHKDIAANIAMSRETTSRDLEELQKKGLIEQKGHQISINSLSKLKKELKSSLGKV